jgi:hypothetical protein
VTKALTFPACPACEKPVDNLRVWEELAAVPRVFTATCTVFEDKTRYTLIPCGHEVRGFDQNGFSSIVRWVP